MTIRTQLKAGGKSLNHNEALQIRTSLKAGGTTYQHNEALRVRTQLKAGGMRLANHNEALQVRTALNAGRKALLSNHNEVLKIRSAIKAGKIILNHNEKLQRAADRPAVWMRRELLTTTRKEDRLDLLVVRAGLRAGRLGRGRGRARR